MTDTHNAIAPIDIQPLETRRVHPVVAAAMAQAPSPETLRELLAVQREWEAGEARRSYTRALVEVKRSLPTTIAKDATVDFTTSKGRTYYKHASLAGVMDAIVEPLAEHGFSLAWEPSTSERQVTVTCRLTHCDGHSEACTISAPPDTSGSKGPAQAVASTITLLQRYTALSLLGIATADQTEPHGPREVAPESVDVTRNLKAAAWIRRQKLSVTAAEEHVGRPTKEWTSTDLDALRVWVETQGGEQ